MKTRPLVRLIGALALGGMLLLANGSFWLAPAAQASGCSFTEPSAYIPVLRLPQPTNHPDFAVQEKAGQLEVRNMAADPIDVLPFTTTAGLAKRRIFPKSMFTIELENAHHYLEKTPSIGSYCNSDGGVPAGRLVPQTINTLLVLDLTAETVAVPIEIAFVENPNYAADLADYQQAQQREQRRQNLFIVGGVIYVVGVALLCVGVIVVLGLFVRFLRNLS
ncbi:MAG: hypothetical protein H0T53_13785 [Herpetosiphonaceae bacterium]|nr:hypothetical protein [Herpetosiphonaceae bacterium]